MSQPASDNLRRFLMKLAEDPAMVQQLKSDPHGVMSKAGLSESEKKLILSGDKKALEAALGPTANMFMVVIDPTG